MAMYRTGNAYYINGVVSPDAMDKRRVLPAHEFNETRLQMLTRVYRFLVAVQALLVSAPVFLILLCTLALRVGVTTFCMNDVSLQAGNSSAFYQFY